MSTLTETELAQAYLLAAGEHDHDFVISQVNEGASVWDFVYLFQVAKDISEDGFDPRFLSVYDLTEEAWGRLVDLSVQYFPTVAAVLSQDSSVLAALYDAENEELLMALVHNDECPAEVLHQIAKAARHYLLEMVLGHPNCPLEAKWEAARGDRSQRETAARAAGMEGEVLRELASDPEVEVRLRVRNNWAAPEDVHERLSNDPEVTALDPLGNTVAFF